MTTFVALLRAVNVGGQNKVPMAELRSVLEGLGLRNVRTYLQSGNAVFDADAGREADAAQQLAIAIETRLDRDLGLRIGALAVSADALAEVAGANPFAGEPGVDPSWLHVTFLLRGAVEAGSDVAPEADFSVACATAFDKLELPAAVGERAALVGVPVLATPVVYLCLPHGYGRTKLDNAYFERHLGAAATTRNWRTVLALAGVSAG